MKYTTTPDGLVVLENEPGENKRVFSSGDEVLLEILSATLKTMRAYKPDDRTEKDRRYAVTITKMEDVFAYFSTFVMSKE